MCCWPQVKCLECSYESNTFEPFLDLSLEVSRAPTLAKALSHFMRSDALDGANKYKCPREQRLVRAAKAFRIDRAPNVLIIQLKRFLYTHASGHKISRKVRRRWAVVAYH